MVAVLLCLFCCCCGRKRKSKQQSTQFVTEEPKPLPIPGGGARSFRDTGYQAPAAVLATANTVRLFAFSRFSSPGAINPSFSCWSMMRVRNCPHLCCKPEHAGHQR